MYLVYCSEILIFLSVIVISSYGQKDSGSHFDLCPTREIPELIRCDSNRTNAGFAGEVWSTGKCTCRNNCFRVNLTCSFATARWYNKEPDRCRVTRYEDHGENGLKFVYLDGAYVFSCEDPNLTPVHAGQSNSIKCVDGKIVGPLPQCTQPTTSTHATSIPSTVSETPRENLIENTTTAATTMEIETYNVTSTPEQELFHRDLTIIIISSCFVVICVVAVIVGVWCGVRRCKRQREGSYVESDNHEIHYRREVSVNYQGNTSYLDVLSHHSYEDPDRLFRNQPTPPNQYHRINTTLGREQPLYENVDENQYEYVK